MYARTSYSDEEFPSFIVADHEGEYENQGFYAGSPVCPPPQRGFGTVSYSSLLMILAATVASAFAADDATRQDWTAKAQHFATALSSAAWTSPPQQASVLQNSASATPLQPAPASAMTPPPPAAAQPLPTVTVANAPGEAEESQSAGTQGKPHVSDAYAPPPPTTDPYRKKAEAAGLHPDLSRVVLARLTPADYRNAAFAIDKAIRTIPDDGSLTWPRTRKAGTAIFNVHFVEGAGGDCRRYVVTITKDRWTSTALPMEKCGVKVAFRGEKGKTVE
jgi:hypothetical protein